MKLLRLYLDNCCFNRPYQDQSSLPVYFGNPSYSVFNIKELLDSGYVGAGHSVNFSAN